MAHRDIPHTLEHEILDRPLSADGWTFSCCESVSEDGEDTAPANEIEDEVLDRPLSADGWTFSCCESVSDEGEDTVPSIGIEAEILDRPLSTEAAYQFSGPHRCCSTTLPDEKAPETIEAEVLDRPWQADSFYTICCTMGISPEDETLDRPNAARFTAHSCTIAVAPEQVMPAMATASVPAAPADSDRMVDVMLRAGSVFGEVASH